MTYESQLLQKQSRERIGLKYIDFNKDNVRKGAAYEKLVEKDLIKRGYTNVMPGVGSAHKGDHPTIICFKGKRVCSVDFTAINPEGNIEYIEAKGGVTGRINSQNKLCSGATRCDSVKKALINGRLIKCLIPNSTYIIYFSEKPKKGSPTDMMLQVALEFGDLDEVRYLEFYETTN